MDNSCIRRLSNAAILRSYMDPRFKTMRISVNMLVPMRQETAAQYGILPGMVTRATGKYPSLAALNRRLSQLYGASFGAGVRKLGAFQCLSVSIGGISSRYAFGGEDMFAELSELLFSALLHPLLDEEGLFPEESFSQERRQLLELKASEFSDKIAYAHQRCQELLFQGTEAAIDRYGSREAIEALSREELKTAWETLLSSARFEIFALGDCQPEPELFSQRFAKLGVFRELEYLPYRQPETVERVAETQPVAQSKLSMGFRTDAGPEEQTAFRLMSAVFGGVPSSKLFRNVREKMSLCYYCSSSFSPSSRAMFVESGVETKNVERTESAILDQLASIQKGEITREELDAAKLALCNSFRSVGDSLHAVESWYLGQTFSGRELTPEDAARQVMACTAEQVAEAARRVKLGAVYCLKGREES